MIRRKVSDELKLALFSIPAVTFVFVVLIVPLQGVLLVSFLKTADYALVFEVGIQNYSAILTERAYLTLLGRSFLMALLVGVVCLGYAWPVAYIIRKYGGEYQIPLLLLMAAPFFVGFIIRITALQYLLMPAGLLDHFLWGLGVEGRLPIMYSHAGTFIGLFYLWLPFAVVALFIALTEYDFRYEHLAASCGASRLQRFFKVTLPINWVGTLVAFGLVFIPALGASTTAAFLGGPGGALFGTVMANQVDSATWARGAAMAAVLFIISIILIYALWRIVKSSRSEITGLVKAVQ